jgi:hypothetical protein
MEHFEHKALSSAIKKPTRWKSNVDDMFTVWPHEKDDRFTVWPHEKDELQEFLKHLNNIPPNIKFTKEVEQNKTLPFMDVLVSRRPNGSLGHSVYWKSTHTELYLHAKSQHHPAQKTGCANCTSPACQNAL